MALQHIVDQAWYATRKTALGMALSFSLASAPQVVYGINNRVINAALSHGGTIRINPGTLDSELDTVPEAGNDLTILHYLYQESLLTESGERALRLQPDIVRLIAERKEYLRNVLRISPGVLRFKDHSDNFDIVELTERLSFPSLAALQQHYHPLEQKKGSFIYQAKTLAGYYVHYPQTQRIYYAERRAKKTIIFSIADENGTILFRANEQGEMVAVSSPTQVSTAKPTPPPPVKNEVKQPHAVDIGIFQNMFDCQAKLDLYSSTSAGVGFLAVVGPLAALYLRRRHNQRKSRQK